MSRERVCCPNCRHAFVPDFIEKLKEGIIEAARKAGAEINEIPGDLPPVKVICRKCEREFELNLREYTGR